MRVVSGLILLLAMAMPAAARERTPGEAAAHVLGYIEQQQARLEVCVRRFPSVRDYFSELQGLRHHNAKWQGRARDLLVREALARGIAEPDTRQSIKDMVRLQERQVAYDMDQFEGGPQAYCSTQAGFSHNRVGDYVPVELAAPRELQQLQAVPD